MILVTWWNLLVVGLTVPCVYVYERHAVGVNEPAIV